jgi:hypothetical protein
MREETSGAGAQKEMYGVIVELNSRNITRFYGSQKEPKGWQAL